MSTFIGLNDSGSLSVMTHLGRDTSDDAIKREIRKSTGKDPDSIQWSRITKSEADEILRGLVVGEAEADPTTPPDVGVDMSAIIDELARLHRISAKMVQALERPDYCCGWRPESSLFLNPDKAFNYSLIKHFVDFRRCRVLCIASGVKSG